MPAPDHSVFTGRMPLQPPNQRRQSTEGTGETELEKFAVAPTSKATPVRISLYHSGVDSSSHFPFRECTDELTDAITTSIGNK